MKRVTFGPLNPRRIDTLAKLANLDQRSIDRSWSLAKFDSELSRKRTQGIGVADPMGNLLAYAIYDVGPENDLLLVRLVVSPEHRRMGIATRLMDQIVKMSRMLRGPSPKLAIDVSEKDVEAWKFFREYGRRSGLPFKTFLVKGDPDDYFGFTFSIKEQPACV